MIVSPGRNFVFVHVPKTGGTALALALEARAQADDVLIGDTPKARLRRGRLAALPVRGRLWKHSTLADLDGWLGADDLARMFVFTLVRNPWDRMLSLYAWSRAQRFRHPVVALAQSADFTGFLRDPDLQARVLAAPVAAYVTDASGRERCDAFVRLERFAEDVAPVEDHLGFALRPLPRANASDRPRDWRTAYDDEGREIVARLCADDIRRFGYRFDP